MDAPETSSGAASEAPARPSQDIISSLVVLAFSITVFFIAGDLPVQSQIFPRAVAVLMVICGGLMLIRALLAQRAASAAIAAGAAAVMRTPMVAPLKTGLIILYSLLYVAAVGQLGFVISSIIFIFVTAHTFGFRKPVALVLTPIGFVGCVYFLFERVLHTPLPTSPFFGWM